MATVLEPTDPCEQLRAVEVPAIVSSARALTVQNADDFAAAGDFLKRIKGAQKKADEIFDPVIAKAHEAHKAALAAKAHVKAPLSDAEGVVKRVMLGYQQEEQRKADAERRRLQAIADEAARKEREKAEAEAARQREIERQAREKAEAARRAAEEADAAERKRLLAQAAAAERKAEAAAEKVEAKQEEAATAIAPVIHVAVESPKVQGVSTRKTWKAEIVDRAALLAYIYDRKRDDLVIVNEKVIDAYAKAMRDGASMPGVRFYAEETLASRGY